jgi:DNA-binding CsgD family transcriptional regulator
MFPQKNPKVAPVESKTYPLGEKSEHPENKYASALVALSHTTVEHRLYSAMLTNSNETGNGTAFTARRLMTLTGIRSLSTARRGLEGLLVKLSIEREEKGNGNGKREQATHYRVYAPEEIITRRREIDQRGTGIYGLSTAGRSDRSFERALARVAENSMLSRRESQVALCCVEGLTNADIGKRLSVSEQTVKFHLRHVYLKFGVKRRAELISRLLM